MSYSNFNIVNNMLHVLAPLHCIAHHLIQGSSINKKILFLFLLKTTESYLRPSNGQKKNSNIF